MTAITVPSDQYRAFDLGGQVVAERRTRAHNLNEQSGGGFEAILRQGDDFADGLSVSFSMTDEQLEELGFISKATISDEIQARFEAPQGGLSLQAYVGGRLALRDLARELGLANPYQLEDEDERAIPELAEMPDIEPPFDFFPMIDFEDYEDREPEPEPVGVLGLTASQYDAAAQRAGKRFHSSDDGCFTLLGCSHAADIMAAHNQSVAENQKPADPPKFAFCQSCRKMVDLVEVPHDQPKPPLVYCVGCCEWVPLGKLIHSAASPSIDTTGNRVHPEAR